MKFKVGKASSLEYKSTVEISTLEELRKFSLENDTLIIYFDEGNEEFDGNIIIYDDYFE